jgi:hypothetical protein
MSQLYSAFSAKLPPTLRVQAGALIGHSERHNRRLAPIEMQRITLVAFAAWVHVQDHEATRIAPRDWAEILESAARCAQVLRPHHAAALNATLIAYFRGDGATFRNAAA